MSDYERYGDYDNIDDEPPRPRNPVLIALRIITSLIIFSFIGVLAFRLITFNTYPESVKKLYFNDSLASYYDATDGEIGAKTQNLRAPYDDPDLGRFFCEYLVIIEDIDQLQITVRYNVSTVARAISDTGLDLDENDPGAFSFRFVDNYGRVYSNVETAVFDSRAMYRYLRLVCDGVDFSPERGENPEWIRLEVFVGADMSGDPYAMVPVYENNDVYSAFSDYNLSGKEHP